MKRCMLALAIALPVAAHAQSSKPDPSDAKAPAPPLRHESALSGYRPFKAAPPAPWKQVNEEVKGTGGHAAHGTPKKEPEPDKPDKPAEHKHK